MHLGLVADSSYKLSKLESLVEATDYEVGASIVSVQLSDSPLPQVDAWVVSLDMNADRSFVLLERLEDDSVPVIYDDADSLSGMALSERAKQFCRKIDACVNVRKGEAIANRQKAKKIWVLAASTGGPEAIIAFFKRIPDNLENVAFIYVQHNHGGRMTDNLLQVLARNTTWQVYNSDSAHRIDEGCVYVVSPEHQIDIDDMGNLVPILEPWEGPYSPSVDQVLAKVARRFGKESGAIIFSGMGDDGAKTCRLVTHSGGKVWVQAPMSCAVDSMPREAIAREVVSFIGTPELLAQEFIALHRSPVG